MDAIDEPGPPTANQALSWRTILFSHDFARDLLVTTLGVLIALGIGEVADGWRKKVAAGDNERAVREELQQTYRSALVRVLAQRCIERRLADLNAVLSDARRTGRLPLITGAGSPPLRRMFDSAWQVALNSGATLQMPARRVADYRGSYLTQAQFGTMAMQEQAAFARIRLLESRPGAWPNAVTEPAETAIADAQHLHGRLLGYAMDMVAGARAQGIPLRDYYGEPMTREQLVREVREGEICNPLKVDGRPFRSPLPGRKPA